MKFKTENEGFEYIKGKEIKDPQNYLAKKQMPDSVEECQEHFDEWLEKKMFMFSPEEMIALTGKDYRGRKGSKNQDVRDHQINVFVDWAEEQPRRRAIIIVEAQNIIDARVITKKVDLIGGDNAISVPLSSDGKEPATHYMSSWNCSASEYDFFGEQNQLWWRLFDGADIDIDKFLATLNLKKIIISEQETMIEE